MKQIFNKFMREYPQRIPSEVRQTTPKTFSEKIAAFGATFGNVIGKLDVTKSQPYQRVKEGFRRLDQRLTALENAETQRAEIASRNVNAKLRRKWKELTK